MSAPESIVLPRSGLVLTRETRFEDGSEEFSDSTGCARIYAIASKWRGYCCDQTEDFGIRDECLAWLDTRVLSLRAALLAGTEERIARACYEFDREATWEERTNSDVETYMEQARAVLSALTGGTDE